MLSEVPTQNISEIVNINLCIGCGFCSVACPESAITMAWQDRRTWHPKVDEGGCTYCSRCVKACPQSPQCIAEYAAAAQDQGVRFGVPQNGTYFIAYDKDDSRRVRSASGGVTTALLERLLSSGSVDGVLASLPLEGAVGEPHFQMKIFRSVEDLGQGRSSHYHPLSYDKVLNELIEDDGSFAVVGVPCVLRGIGRLPTEIQQKIKYTVCLVCSHNVTGAFSDCLSSQEGVRSRESWQINLRDKQGIPDANNFNNLFILPDRQVRKNRFDTAFTAMWRNYFFAQECCLYCPDFYGVDADVSIKDAWGRLSSDPLGTSLVIVKNGEIKDHLLRLQNDGRLFLEACDSDEVFNSQTITPIFKHEKIRDRVVWKKIIKQELDEKHSSIGWKRRWFSRDSHEYWRLWSLMKLSEFFYFRFAKVPVKGLLLFVSPLSWKTKLKNLFGRTKSIVERLWSKVARPILRSSLLFFGLRRPTSSVDNNRLRVLIAGGYGYGNVGDEAQLAANLQHWRRLDPGCRLTVLTPNRDYTDGLHGPIRVELASRKALFSIRGEQEYFGSVRVFKLFYPLVAAFCLFNACLLRAGLPVFGLTSAQARLLNELNDSDVLFLSGGGYLTGMTLTRLWDNMLLIRLASALGVPTILSGQTIGVFKDSISRRLARWGLKKSSLIYLRDPVDSAKDLAPLGLKGDWIKSTFDDALFFQGASEEQIAVLLHESGSDAKKPYLAVNVHFWGQEPADSRVIMTGMASALDRIHKNTGLQIVFVPMVQSDEAAIEEVRAAMNGTSAMPKHGYRPDLAVGLIQNAALCVTMKHHPIIFAMAAAVPTVALAFDDYYQHKNYGAMKIFHQEDRLLKSDPVELEQQLYDAAQRVFAEKTDISQTIAEVVETLKPMSGEVISKFLAVSK